MTKGLCLECIEAEKKSEIDIIRLLEKLTLIKGNVLSSSEIIYLCLSLCQYSNYQIAYRLYKHKLPSLKDLSLCNELKRMERNMKSEMSNRVNAYLKELMNLDADTRRPSWARVIIFLQKNGYKKLLVDERNLEAKPKFFLLCEGDKTLEEVTEILKQHGMCTLTSGRII